MNFRVAKPGKVLVLQKTLELDFSSHLFGYTAGFPLRLATRKNKSQ